MMRQVHVGGDKLFVDYAGMKPQIVDPITGEITAVELFVAVLGASNYTYAEGEQPRTQSVPDFVGSVSRTLAFLGGAPRAIVPDQLKSAIVKACRYDPGVQRTTAELARYYEMTILPARPKSPRDKAKVEVAVQIAERWLLARIRNETFTSLGALNARLAVLIADLNARVMRTYKASRRELFERLDKPALAALPAEPFEASTWKKVGLNIDYHVAFEHHFYSAPHALRHEDIELWLRATASTVAIFHGRERVAAHVRSYVRGGFTTKPEHMPSSRPSRARREWTPSRILGWADQIGTHVRALCEVILREEGVIRNEGYRSCLGLFRLAKKYGNARLDAASRRALYSRRARLSTRPDDPRSQPRRSATAARVRRRPATAGTAHENVRTAPTTTTDLHENVIDTRKE